MARSTRFGDYVTATVIGGNDDGYPQIRQGYYIRDQGNEALIVGAYGDVYRSYPKTLVKVVNVEPLTADEYVSYSDELARNHPLQC
jgi:hypothetical protein